MSGPSMSSLPLPSMTRGELAAMLDRLSDDQKRFVVQQLMPSILADVREPRSVTDVDGHLLGYYMPRNSLAGDDLLGASDSGSFCFPRSESIATATAVVTRPKRRKAHDLFEADLGGSD